MLSAFDTSIAMRLLLLLCATALPFVGTGCRSQSGQAAERTVAGFEIPELKPRSEGLAEAEFQRVRDRYMEYKGVIAASPAKPEAYVGIAQIFMSEARTTGDHPYYYPAAMTMLDEALRRAPDNLPALVAKGSVLLSLHHFEEALALGKRAELLAPDMAVIQGIICDANLELGRYEQAVAAADRMVALRPDLRSYSRVSYLREIHGDDAGAIEAMRMAVEAGAPGSEETEWARFSLGGLHLGNGDLAEAERAFLMALATRPNYPFALAGMARVRAAQGRTDEALRLLDSASALVPEFSFAEMQADLHRAAGDDALADSLVSVVETMLGEDEAAGHYADKEFALLYANHGVKPEAAVERARKELARRPENIEAQHAMARTLLRAGNATEAKKYIEQARRLNRTDAVMMTDAGLIEIALGNRAEGRKLLREALAIDPYLAPLLLAEVRKALGTA